MSWTILILAGILEAGWAIGLKYTDGFTRLVPSLLTGTAIVVSLFMLSIAARTLPIGTAYAVWVGIGASGAAVMGMLLLGETASPARLFFLGLMLVAIVGLKITAGPATAQAVTSSPGSDPGVDSASQVP
jgi:quaternary ammonium compound-resistance protein SugE